MQVNINEQELYCLNIINSPKVCFLTTINEGGMPETRAMLNLRNDDLYPGLKEVFTFGKNKFTVCMTTNTSSQKMKQIIGNPKVSVYFCLPDAFRGVMLNGIIKQVHDPVIKNKLWQDSWDMYYPKGAEDPDYTILVLEPETVKVYGNLNTFSFNPGDAS
jgi:general stress protein 26